MTRRAWTISIQMLCSEAALPPESTTLSVNKFQLCLAWSSPATKQTYILLIFPEVRERDNETMSGIPSRTAQLTHRQVLPLPSKPGDPSSGNHSPVASLFPPSPFRAFVPPFDAFVLWSWGEQAWQR